MVSPPPCSDLPPVAYHPKPPQGYWVPCSRQQADARSDASTLLAAVNCQPASLGAGNFVMTVSEGRRLLGEVQVWCCRCGGAVQDAGMLWVPAINSSACGEAPGSHLRNCQVSISPQLRTWLWETYREKKKFGKSDFIALGLCEENNQRFITA